MALSTLLDEAERLYASDFFPNVRPIAALKARVWVEQDRLVEALDWARERKLSVEDDLSYLREFEHITLARILLARYKSDHADRSILETMGLLERLLKAAEEGGGREAQLKSWYCRRLLTTHKVISLLHSCRCNTP